MPADDRNKDTIEYKTKKQKIIAFSLFSMIFVCLGVFVTVQARTAIKNVEKEKQEEQATLKSYEDSIKSLEEDIAVLSGEISEMDAEYDEKMEQLASSDNDFFRILEFYNDSIAKYGFYAGTTDVTGKGIEISIDDGNPTSGTVSNFLLVHDTTLLNIVNELRASGAQAVSVNGERIVADTEILCVGTGIRVNGKKIFAPFSIKAIGNSDRLYSTFINSAVYKNIITADLLVSVIESDSVNIAGYTGFSAENVKYLYDSAEE
ncbi:MAG: DUF881 domain-containing protein [Clostridia bacterium]|nr:DUF881 domain-containing protein [Clostridia bacterium]